jgi:hypothetical protein
MREIGAMIWLMERAFICTLVVQDMRANGKMIYKTATELKLGQVLNYKLSSLYDINRLEKNQSKKKIKSN